MSKYKSDEIEMPMNANERFLYQAIIRLDALCHMVSDIVEHIAKQEGITQENVTEEIITSEKADEINDEKPKPRKRTKK